MAKREPATPPAITPSTDDSAPGRLRLRGTVAGRVQGVGFRAFVRRNATRLGLDGWVRNLPDGQVELDATGTAESVGALQALLQRGPLFGRVDRLDLTVSSPEVGAPEAGSGFVITA